MQANGPRQRVEKVPRKATKTYERRVAQGILLADLMLICNDADKAEQGVVREQNLELGSPGLW